MMRVLSFLQQVQQVLQRVRGVRTPPLTCDEADEADEAGLFTFYVHAPTYARTRRMRRVIERPASSASSASPAAHPYWLGGRAPMVDEGNDHRMMMAFPSRDVAASRNLNRNHHVRVWCTCQEQSASPAGTYAGQHATVVNPRTQAQAAADPRRLGGWDDLGYVDVRVPNSALDLWREHVRLSSDGGSNASANH